MLVESWRNCSFELPPYLFSRDNFLKDGPYSNFICDYRSFSDFIDSKEFCSVSDTRLHVGLLPIPYIGNLQKSSVFILMLNPGLGPGDYFAEHTIKNYRVALIKNLRQDNTNDEYPFLFLDPQFSWHPGFVYWQSKLHEIITQLADQSNYQASLKQLAQNISCLQLVPYHSKSFHFPPSILRKLGSTKLIIEYVQDELAPKARREDILVIVIRGKSIWNLPKHKNIIIYESNEARFARLTLSSHGGKAIAQQLNLSRGS